LKTKKTHIFNRFEKEFSQFSHNKTLNKTQKVLAKFKINVQPFLTGIHSQKDKLKNKSARIHSFFIDLQ
jgi:hypothetical protein